MQGSAKDYVQFVHDSLVELQKDVKENIILGKTDVKQQYDRGHKVVEPSWCVGNRVLLLNKRPDVQRNRILGHRPYNSPIWLIIDVVSGQGCDT